MTDDVRQRIVGLDDFLCLAHERVRFETTISANGQLN